MYHSVKQKQSLQRVTNISWGVVLKGPQAEETQFRFKVDVIEVLQNTSADILNKEVTMSFSEGNNRFSTFDSERGRSCLGRMPILKSAGSGNEPFMEVGETYIFFVKNDGDDINALVRTEPIEKMSYVKTEICVR